MSVLYAIKLTKGFHWRACHVFNTELIKLSSQRTNRVFPKFFSLSHKFFFFFFRISEVKCKGNVCWIWKMTTGMQKMRIYCSASSICNVVNWILKKYLTNAILYRTKLSLVNTEAPIVAYWLANSFCLKSITYQKRCSVLTWCSYTVALCQIMYHYI